MADRERVLLLYPPQAQPFLPHLALPQLAAVLRREGIAVTVRDLNLEAYEHFLSAPVLQRLGMEASAAAGVEAATCRIRTGEKYFDLPAYFAAIRDLQSALACVSGNYPGLFWSLKNFSLERYSSAKWKEIHQATLDPAQNIFVDYFAERIAELAALSPDVVGISVSWREQVIPAFTLARLIKERMPDTCVCMGGSMLTHLSPQLKAKPEAFAYVDGFLPYEGETAIVALVRSARARRWQDVPGLIYRDGPKVVSNPTAPPEDLASLPFPDFDGLPLDRYYSPRPYLPMLTSRGCYYGKCAFCSHHISGNKYRRRQAEDVVAEMDAHHARYGCSDFYFVDDSLPPALGLEIAREVGRGRRSHRWAAELRMEKNMDPEYFRTLHEGGAHLLLFGLESGSQRVMDLMDKGIDKAVARQVLRDASDAGIVTWVFFFLGFPGETKAEAEETMQFLIEMSPHIDMAAGGTFTLTRNSPIWDRAAEYGIDFVVEEPHRDMDLAPRFWLKPELQWDVKNALRDFKRRRESAKFTEPFVAETHLMFFDKGHFQAKKSRDTHPLHSLPLQ